ncbi:MAG: patatin-like phospholipase family protein [Gemmatimonadales bacterium]
MRCAVVLAVSLSVAGLPAPVAAQGRCPDGPVALVLSGGGAKGLAHIGVLRILDSLGVRPDLIVGSSMGAIIGALYASGYSGREIDSIARAIPLGALFRSYEPETPQSLGPLRPLVVWEQSDRGLVLQRAAVPDGPINAWLGATLLRGNLVARGDFSTLPIPFYAVATDLARRQAVPLSRGDLAQAVRASMAIPLVFEPVQLDGRYLADGGLSANTPIRVARSLGARTVIASELIQSESDSVDLTSPLTVADYLVDYLFRQPGDTALPGDLVIRSDITGIGNLDFTAAALDTAIARGAAAARAALSTGVACLLRAASPLPTAVTGPAPVLAGTTTQGLGRAEANDLLRELGLISGLPLDTARLRAGILKLAASDRFRAVWLHPDSSAGPGKISLAIEAQRTPARVAALGVAYDNELSARMWAGAVDRQILNRAVEASAVLFLGGLRNELDLGVRRTWRDRGAPRPTATLTLLDQHLRTFDPAGVEQSQLRAQTGVGFAGLEWLPGVDWVVQAGMEGVLWGNSLVAGQRTGGMVVHALHTAGGDQTLFKFSMEWTGRYRLAAVEWVDPLQWGEITITPHFRLGLGDALPLQLTFPLGGDDGFPGLHIYELRGDREAFGAVTIAVPVVRSLDLRAEAATGQTAFDASGMALSNWHVGGRIGFGLGTPLGYVRLEYGVTRGFRDQVLFRVGQWF